MPNSQINRRHMMAAGAAAAAAAGIASANAAPRTAAGGFSPERLAKIPAALQAYVDDGADAGFVTLLYRRGEIAQVNAVGFRDYEAKLPMERDTIFRMASMTKPVTCVAALHLMEQRGIGLADPVDKWLPEFANPKVLNDPAGPLDQTHPASRAITFADLLTHRSGIVGQFNPGPAADAARGLNADDPTFDAWLKRLSAIPLVREPGSHFVYGTSHDVLGAFIQRVSGKSFGDYLKAELFDPLGMKDTGFWMPQAKQGRIAALNSRDASGKLVSVRRPVPNAPRNYASGAGGLLSTADDYLQFARMLLNKGELGGRRYLSARTVAEFSRNWLTPEQRAEGAMGLSNFWASQGFGLGVSVTDNPDLRRPLPYTGKGSYGWPGATGVWWRVDPAREFIPIFLVQNAFVPPGPGQAAAAAAAASRPAAARPPAAVAFFDLAYQAIEA